MLAGIVTSILLLLFVGGWLWLWRPSHLREFDAAARIPLDDDVEPQP
ncbi:MAG: cbb3-type cytochrome oxidase subunit 3 [Luteimonas sp.]